jgi:hypothetical protein
MFYVGLIYLLYIFCFLFTLILLNSSWDAHLIKRGGKSILEAILKIMATIGGKTIYSISISSYSRCGNFVEDSCYIIFEFRYFTETIFLSLNVL